jgi:3alpha(or 20beta)-hydroxysteroid dehydrogenase
MTTGGLTGKVALVTGAARGTGEATARLLVREGACVALADILDEPGEAVAKELGDAACYVHLDVTNEADWKRAVAHTVDRFGSLDVLVNNAAVLHMSAIAETELADFERVVRVNQTGTFLGIKSVVEPMKRAGRGSIVNVSSIDGLQGHNGAVAYCSS